MLHVVAPGHVLLMWTEDKNDPQYERSETDYQILTTTLDTKDCKIKVTKLHQPGPLFIEPVESDDIDLSNTMARAEGLRMPASYANFYIANQAIILLIFGDKYDDLAITTLQTVFPNHKIKPIMAREIMLGRGNIHCITQQQPKSSK